MKTLREILKEKGISQKIVADALNVDVSTLRRYDDLSKRSVEEVLVIEEATGIPFEMLTGKKIVSKLFDISKLESDQKKEISYTHPNNGNTLIPLLPISAQGGSLNDFVSSIKDEDCEKIISPIKDATFAITISGDSMAPEYPSGSQVLIKRIDRDAFIEWGRVYVLDTCNGVVVKRLIPSERKECIKCVSDNNALIYAPFDVRMSDIYGIYRVMLSMSIK